MITVEKLIKRYTRRKLLLFVGDSAILFIFIISFLSIGYWERFYTKNAFGSPLKVTVYSLAVFLTLLAFRYLNLYKEKIYLTGFEQFTRIIKGVSFSSIFLILTIFFVKLEQLEINSRYHVILFFTGSIFLISVYRISLLKFYWTPHKIEKLLSRKVIAIGAGEAGIKFAKEILFNKTSYFDLVGFIDDDPKKQGEKVGNIPVLGTINELINIVKDFNIDEIFITIESISYDKIFDLIELGKITGCQVNIISSHYKIIQRKYDTYEFNDFHSIPIFTNISPIYTKFIKLVIDRIVSLINIILFLPIFLSIAIAIKLTSSGPIIYKTRVIGKDGIPFTWYKFRTMKAGNDQSIHKNYLKKIIRQNGSVQKIQDDPRITKVGRFLRKYSLDEIPQLFNVLKGDMSLVGPRPCLPYEYEMMDSWQQRRTNVVPGITGLWQISGRNRADVNFNDSVILDLYYADNLSCWFDIKILIKTIPVVLLGKGA